MDAAQGETAPARDVIGAAAAFLTAAMQFQTVNTRAHGVFIVVAGVFWLAFVAVRVAMEPSILKRWGFRSQNLAQSSAVVGALLGVVLIGFAVYASVQKTFYFPLHACLLLLLYPIWGLIQQFIVQGVVVNTLMSADKLSRRRWLVVLIGAVLFGLVHLPEWPLVFATFGMGLVFVPIYLKYRNLWPLGIAHGWLGTFFYLWVLEHDPWLGAFG